MRLVLHNTSTAIIALVDGSTMQQNEIIFHDSGYDLSTDNSELVEQIRGLLRARMLVEYPLTNVRPKYWPDWQFIEYAVYHHAFKNTPSEQPPYTWPPARDLFHYLQEKVPHLEPAIGWGNGNLSLCCLAEIRRRVWTDLVVPEFRRVSKKHGLSVYVAESDADDPHKINIKMHIAWKTRYGRIYRNNWCSVHDYFNIRRFLSVLDSVDTLYTP